MGCQSAFYICSAMGLYPLMGQDLYFLVPPVFNKVTLLLGAQANPVPLTIETQGAGSGSGKGIFCPLRSMVRSWTVHGSAMKKSPEEASFSWSWVLNPESGET